MISIFSVEKSKLYFTVRSRIVCQGYLPTPVPSLHHTPRPSRAQNDFSTPMIVERRSFASETVRTDSRLNSNPSNIKYDLSRLIRVEQDRVHTAHPVCDAMFEETPTHESRLNGDQPRFPDGIPAPRSEKATATRSQDG